MKPTLAAILAAVTCASCAAHPPGGPAGRQAHGPPPGDPGPGRGLLFLSPSGEPFRGGAGEADRLAAWFAKADADHDGNLTRQEFGADAQAFFTRLDADAGGDIGMAEVSIYEQTIVPELTEEGPGGGGGPERGRGAGGGGGGRRGPPPGAGGGGGGGGPELRNLLQGAARYSLINEAHPIRGADSDFNMRVSLAEWRSAADRRFGLLDKDGDGVLHLADLHRPAMGRDKRRREFGDRR